VSGFFFYKWMVITQNLLYIELITVARHCQRGRRAIRKNGLINSEDALPSIGGYWSSSLGSGHDTVAVIGVGFLGWGVVTTVMPLQNRVTPFGALIATPERGTLLGNRGLLHDPEKRIKREWLLVRWIYCVLEFKGRHRTVMSPGRYTELFFLDEATSLAAGHRACAECKRARYNEFREAWVAANPHTFASDRPSAVEIDNVLHEERLDGKRTKRAFLARLGELPDGVFVTLDRAAEQPLLVQGDSLLAWSPGGYRARLPRSLPDRVSVLTPESTVKAIRSGFAPAVHASAGTI